MTPTPFLRAASVLSFLFAAGHTLGGKESWSPPGETDVLAAMRSFRFDAEGVNRTYLEFYLGFGYTISIYLLLQAVVLWQLAAVAKAAPRLARPMIAAVLVASLASAVVSWKFIFAVPALFSVLVAACLAAALVALSHQTAN